MLLFPFWILLLIVIFAHLKRIKKFSFKKGIIISIVFLLFAPHIVSYYNDGGSKIFWAPSYQIIRWKRLEKGPSTPGYSGVEIHFFPNNFHDLNYWVKKHGY